MDETSIAVCRAADHSPSAPPALERELITRPSCPACFRELSTEQTATMDEAWRLVGMAGEAGGPTVGPGEGVLVAVVDWCRVVRRTGRQAFDGVALGLGRIVLLGVPAARCDVPADRKGADARVPADPRQRRPVCRSGSRRRRMWLGLEGLGSRVG